MINAYLLHGSVMHARQGAVKNAFRYPVFSLCFLLAEESLVVQTLRSRFRSLLSLNAKDYLDGKSESLNQGVRDFLLQSCSYEAEEIWLQTFPRMLGYAFNPISFWFCKRAGVLEAVLCEVNNTFGERHFYWVKSNGPEISTEQWLRAEKNFHVSPFFPVEGYYDFRFKLTQGASQVDISYFGPQGELRLATSVSGKFEPLQQASFLPLFARYGWMTVLVVLRIHWQAFRLWLKKASFHSKPDLPDREISS
ncbi:MAG: DUF1365 domain-containing protein [Bdellovibrio sp.]|nr:DUF1365 domain-containing protein [Bdellovibrio sp.]